MRAYLDHEVDILGLETVDLLGVGDSAVELLHLLLGNALLADLLGQPLAHEALRLFEGDWVGVVDEHWQFGHSVRHYRDACAHLASSDHAE